MVLRRATAVFSGPPKPLSSFRGGPLHNYLSSEKSEIRHGSCSSAGGWEPTADLPQGAVLRLSRGDSFRAERHPGDAGNLSETTIGSKAESDNCAIRSVVYVKEAAVIAERHVSGCPGD